MNNIFHIEDDVVDYNSPIAVLMIAIAVMIDVVHGIDAAQLLLMLFAK